MTVNKDGMIAAINTRISAIDSSTKASDFLMVAKAAAELELVNVTDVTELMVRPAIILPESDSHFNSPQPTITWQPFSANLGTVHVSTRIQISTNTSFTALHYDVISSDLTSHAIPQTSALSANTEYYCRILFISSNNTISEWASYHTFSTSDVLANVFSVDAYTGNTPNTQFIQTNLDLQNRQGVFWATDRGGASRRRIMYTTALGPQESFFLDTKSGDNGPRTHVQDVLRPFSSTGVTLGEDTFASYTLNASGRSHIMWTFIQQQGFFSTFTYAGNSTPAAAVPHGLGAEVGHIAIKKTAGANHTSFTPEAWHRGFSASEYLLSSQVNSVFTSATRWDGKVPDETNVYVGDASLNNNGDDYFGYAFAHKPEKGIFCGMYSGTNAAGNKQTLGADFPVYWLLVKDITTTGEWMVFDRVRSPTNPVRSAIYLSNDANAEATTVGNFNFLSDGFDFVSSTMNKSGRTYVFIAIADPTTFTG